MNKIAVIVFACLILLPAVAWADGWQEPDVQDSPPARYDHAMVNLDGDLYVFGGQSSAQATRGTILGDMWRFSGAQARWEEEQANNPPWARYDHAMAALDGKVYLFAGQDATETTGGLWVYDPATNSWTNPYMVTAMGGRRNLSMTAAQGKLWVSGGNNGGSTVNTLYSYDPISDTWEQKTDLPEPIEGHTSVAYDGELYIFGDIGELLVYDIAQDSWYTRNVTSVPARRHHVAVASGGLMHVCGGEDTLDQELSDCWDYLFALDEWIPKSALPFPLSRSAAAMLTTSHQVVVFGGLSGGVETDTTLTYAPDPVVRLNFARGAPGSFFTLYGYGFPANSTATITVNGEVLGTVPTDANGDFSCVLSTASADEGVYYATASVNPEATVRFTLDSSEPTRPQDGSGPVIDVPTGIALTEFVFLPMVLRQ